MGVSADSVRRWALSEGFTEDDMHRAEVSALAACASRLFQALHNEPSVGDATEIACSPNGWVLRLGREPMIEAPVGVGLPFGRIELSGLPLLKTAGDTIRIGTAEELLEAIEVCRLLSDGDALPNLRDDFLLSYWNIVLNHLLSAQLLLADYSPPEPVYRGHDYYPFPGLRDGPTPEMISSCSNLTATPIAIPIFEVPDLVLSSRRFASVEECMHAVSGVDSDSNTILVHPWQRELSEVLKSLVSLRLIRDHGEHAYGSPLASQRTVRLVTGYDVKLAVAATVTGEHRLIQSVNRLVSQLISEDVSTLSRSESHDDFEIQEDIATVSHPDPWIGSHLSMIVRETPQSRDGETLFSALNTWSTSEPPPILSQLLQQYDPDTFMARYVRVVANGPIRFYTRWGCAFEPHMQNTILRFNQTGVVGIVLRDLDGTILHHGKLARWCPRADVPLFRQVWDVMPSYTMGARRLIHALVTGHFACVVARLSAWTESDPFRLGTSVESELNEVIGSYAADGSAATSDLVDARRMVRGMLDRRLRRGAADSFAESGKRSDG
jgi:hypothetical protein